MPNLYDITVPAFIKTLEMLDTQLQKAKAHAENLKVRDVNSMLQDRLVFDQFPLVRQIQLTCDTAKLRSAALAGIDAPAYEDTETTFDQVHERIAKTIAFLKTLTKEQFVGRDSVVLPYRWAPGKGMSAWDNVTAFALPNFYFHAATAYAIMRKNGVQIGKGDFLGALPLVDVVEN